LISSNSSLIKSFIDYFVFPSAFNNMFVLFSAWYLQTLLMKIELHSIGVLNIILKKDAKRVAF
jgi:pantothenate kinase-related protein Tda10